MNKTIDPFTSSQKTMTLEEARKVMWLRSNYRPLGDLLDEGYLTEDRLAWAATRAYDPMLRQAAQSILQWQKHSQGQPRKTLGALPAPTELLNTSLPVPLTLEQARATAWPFRPYKGQSIGMLIETKQISFKDLGFAVENAWDERVRQAAIVLLLVGLQQAIEEPRPSAGVLNVISGGRSFALRRQFLVAYVEGTVLGGALAFAISLFIYFLTRPQPAQPTRTLPDYLSTSTGTIAVILAIVLCIVACLVPQYLLDHVILARLERARENYRKGQEGEERVVELIRQTLDGTWHLFQNIVLPGRRATDLDAVLVGPSGVWVLEVKAFSGEYRNIGEHWEYRAGNRWKLTRKSPSQQAQANATQLSTFLKADNIKRWVTPVVIWADPESPLTTENPTTAVWKLDHLLDELGNIWQGETVLESERQQIVEKLTKLCQEQQKARNGQDK